MSAIQRQEELIEKLQEAVSHYLNEEQFEIAKQYSELLKIACEAYRDLKGESRTQTQELPQRQPMKPFDFSSRTQPKINSVQQQSVDSRMVYQQRMQAEYAYNQSQQQPKTVISGYTYGDGADNPKIRASDEYGNWKYEEPNVVITPQQQIIPNKFQQATQHQQAQLTYEDVWSEDNGDMSFQDPRRNGFYQQ